MRKQKGYQRTQEDTLRHNKTPKNTVERPGMKWPPGPANDKFKSVHRRKTCKRKQLNDKDAINFKSMSDCLSLVEQTM